MSIESMDLHTTQITGKFEALCANQHTQDCDDPDGFSHVDFLFVHSGEMQVVPNIVGGNLL